MSLISVAVKTENSFFNTRFDSELDTYYYRNEKGNKCALLENL